jgi:hypothetical protein
MPVACCELGAAAQGDCSGVSRLYSGAMTDAPRYAMYYAAAPDSTLDRFGAQMLGYDAFTGEELLFPDGIVGIVPDWREITRDPRTYGFHATLKPPMALAKPRPKPNCLRPANPSRDRPTLFPR